MPAVQAGRHTARIEGEFVVFVIGMRFNKLWKLHRWMPVFVAMPKMLRELMAHPEKGYLGGRMMIGGRTITMIQHWRSFDQLEAFARNADDPHLPAWRAYTKAIGASGDVGVYHETYRVDAGAYECIYSNMPVMGLAAAHDASHVRIGSPESRARERISAS
jgi:hypothetical protein